MNEEISTVKASRRHRAAAPIAIVLVILCLIGLFTVLRVCFNLTKRIVDNTAQKSAYERMLMPLVMFDPVPFEDPVNYDGDSMLQSSVWAVLMDKDRTLQYDDNLQIVVPASDVDVKCQQLFGPDVKLTHQSFGDYETNFYYDSDTKSYLIPVVTISGFYTPRVDEISKSGDEITLRVGYIPPSSIQNISFSGEEKKEEEPTKYMDYVLHKSASGNWYVYAIRYPADYVEQNTENGGSSVSMVEEDLYGSSSQLAEPDSGVVDGSGSASGSSESASDSGASASDSGASSSRTEG